MQNDKEKGEAINGDRLNLPGGQTEEEGGENKSSKNGLKNNW